LFFFVINNHPAYSSGITHNSRIKNANKNHVRRLSCDIYSHRYTLTSWMVHWAIDDNPVTNSVHRTQSKKILSVSIQMKKESVYSCIVLVITKSTGNERNLLLSQINYAKTKTLSFETLRSSPNSVNSGREFNATNSTV